MDREFVVDKSRKQNRFLYNIVAIIFAIIIFIIYQLNIFTVKIDFFSQLMLIFIIALVLLPMVSELNILNILKIKKDIENLRNETIEKFALLQNTIVSTTNQQNVQVHNHFIGEKEAQELRKNLEERAEEVSEKIKEKVESEDNPELSKSLYRFIVNSKKIEESLNEINKFTFNNTRLVNKSILNQAKYFLDEGIIDKDLYKAIQYFNQKRNNIIHGGKILKKDLEEGNDIAEKILYLLWEAIDGMIDSHLDGDWDSEMNR